MEAKDNFEVRVLAFAGRGTMMNVLHRVVRQYFLVTSRYPGSDHCHTPLCGKAWFLFVRFERSQHEFDPTDI